jgi:hypothetical protein
MVRHARPAQPSHHPTLLRNEKMWDKSMIWRSQRTVWDLLKAVDPTFTVNLERTFQARNANAYEVELLVAPSRAGTMHKTERPRPVPLPEQEWLLLGQPVDRVVICRDGTPARIVAPDPRYFALQKLWLGKQKKRNALKRPKDLERGSRSHAAICFGSRFRAILAEGFERPLSRVARALRMGLSLAADDQAWSALLPLGNTYRWRCVPRQGSSPKGQDARGGLGRGTREQPGPR